MQERLQKVIAHAGIVSRREAERLITEGRVAVNGSIVTQLGTKVDPARDKVKVDDRLVKSFPGKVYVLMNKPAGYVSTLKDPQERPVVTDLLDRINTRVFPVGRLDYDAEGVLLLTNDGELAHRLQHPRYGISRTYEVKVKDVPANSKLSSLRKGVRLEDGITLPAKAKFLKKTTKNCWLKITLYEGKNRQVKRMCAAIGHPVLKIKRVSLGPLSLGDVSRGKYRHLTQDEVKELYALVSLKL
jgi:23S rRNA pseudouridine2605 synthase/16S rRNA pseudouridine516 synthase